MHKIKLSVIDRILISNILPEKSDLISLGMARDIQNLTKFSEKEVKEISLKSNPDGQGYNWNARAAKDVVVNFSSGQISFLRATIDFLNAQKNIPKDALDLCLKIKESKDSDA